MRRVVHEMHDHYEGAGSSHLQVDSQVIYPMDRSESFRLHCRCHLPSSGRLNPPRRFMYCR